MLSGISGLTLESDTTMAQLNYIQQQIKVIDDFLKELKDSGPISDWNVVQHADGTATATKEAQILQHIRGNEHELQRDDTADRHA